MTFDASRRPPHVSQENRVAMTRQRGSPYENIQVRESKGVATPRRCFTLYRQRQVVTPRRASRSRVMTMLRQAKQPGQDKSRGVATLVRAGKSTRERKRHTPGRTGQTPHTEDRRHADAIPETHDSLIKSRSRNHHNHSPKQNKSTK